MSEKWSIEVLAGRHNRDKFSCGRPSLDEYLRRYARQNAKLGVSKTRVLTAAGRSTVVGYYTVCTGGIAFDALPDTDRKRLPAYPVPTAHLARLAVDSASQGNGLGEILLFDCLRRICWVAQEVGVYAITVKAMDDRAKSFYQQYGFVALVDDPMHLYMLVATVSSLLAGDPPAS